MKFLFSILAALAVSPAMAIDSATPVVSQYSTTMTVRGVTISSWTGTSMVISTSPQYRDICVQNVSTASLFCADTPNISTITATMNAIQLSTYSVIPLPYCFPLVPGKNFYCEYGGTDQGSGRATVILGR
jgi:hypothetical protein